MARRRKDGRDGSRKENCGDACADSCFWSRTGCPDMWLVSSSWLSCPGQPGLEAHAAMIRRHPVRTAGRRVRCMRSSGATGRRPVHCCPRAVRTRRAAPPTQSRRCTGTVPCVVAYWFWDVFCGAGRELPVGGGTTTRCPADGPERDSPRLPAISLSPQPLLLSVASDETDATTTEAVPMIAPTPVGPAPQALGLQPPDFDRPSPALPARPGPGCAASSPRPPRPCSTARRATGLSSPTHQPAVSRSSRTAPRTLALVLLQETAGAAARPPLRQSAMSVGSPPIARESCS